MSPSFTEKLSPQEKPPSCAFARCECRCFFHERPFRVQSESRYRSSIEQSELDGEPVRVRWPTRSDLLVGDSAGRSFPNEFSWPVSPSANDIDAGRRSRLTCCRITRSTHDRASARELLKNRPRPISTCSGHYSTVGPTDRGSHESRRYTTVKLKPAENTLIKLVTLQQNNSPGLFLCLDFPRV